MFGVSNSHSVYRDSEGIKIHVLKKQQLTTSNFPKLVQGVLLTLLNIENVPDLLNSY